MRIKIIPLDAEWTMTRQFQNKELFDKAKKFMASPYTEVHHLVTIDLGGDNQLTFDARKFVVEFGA